MISGVIKLTHTILWRTKSFIKKVSQNCFAERKVCDKRIGTEQGKLRISSRKAVEGPIVVPDKLKKVVIPDETFNRVMGDEYKTEELLGI